MIAPNEPLSTSILVIMYFGDVVFAVSGALMAARYRMDVLGFVLIGTITGIGGGTTRDLLLGRTVWWTQDPAELILCVLASLGTFFFITSDNTRRKGMVWADALGLSVFGVVGCHIALQFGAPPIIAVFMGMVTATGGGLIRDVLTNTQPMILCGQPNATAALLGSLSYAMTIKKALLALGFLLCLALGCSAKIDSSTTDKPQSLTIMNLESTRLGQAAATMASDRGAESGFLLLDRGKDALSWRTILADAAEETIDAQYFLWKDDDAGRIMMQRLLTAADRGVRVRVLIDDSMTESDPEYLALFAAHPNVQLRLYKPFGPKGESTVMRWVDYAADLKVLNRRMHNKLFVVDGSMAIVGGRNIGNEYFEYLGPFAFRSRDLLALGPIVESTGRAFDLYWNSDWTVPIEQVVSNAPTLKAAKQQWQLLDEFASDPSHYPPGFYDVPHELGNELALLEKDLLWGKARLLVDAVPAKNGLPQTHAELDSTGVTLGRITGQASAEVLIQSAYLILLDGGFAGLRSACDRGVQVKLATNSMASNNHLTAFVGYRKQRKRLLETGAELYEMRPDARSEQQLFTAQQLDEYKPSFGLHAKTMVFDRKISFVGSFNLDPRSVNLNTEMGLLVESESLADAIATSIENDMAAGNSWQVIISDRGQIEWVTKENGAITSETETEPMTSKARRAEADVLTIVPDESQL